jgi:hypothetical protein
VHVFVTVNVDVIVVVHVHVLVDVGGFSDTEEALIRSICQADTDPETD